MEKLLVFKLFSAFLSLWSFGPLKEQYVAQLAGLPVAQECLFQELGLWDRHQACAHLKPSQSIRALFLTFFNSPNWLIRILSLREYAAGVMPSGMASAVVDRFGYADMGVR